MNRSRALSNRQSAGTMSPADSATRSPGTSSRSAISRGPDRPATPALPRRITVAWLPTIAFSPSAARCERPSWTKRIAVLSPTMMPITTVALASAPNQDSSASALSNRLNGFL